MTRDVPQEQATISQTEAIRLAIRELGSSAEVPQILDYIWERFGIGYRGPHAPPAADHPTSPAPPGEADEAGPDAGPPRKAGPRRGKGKDRPSPE